MKHRYLINKDTPRQHKEGVFINNNDFKRAMETYVQTPDGWEIPIEKIAGSSFVIDTSNTEDYTTGYFSNEPYTMTGEIIIKEEDIEKIKNILGY